jgi:triacylglycerol esterase/lipase EstA (alpha/beta hydrolase family)
MAQRAGGKVDVIAHSLGGLGTRAAMKWWPDARALVDDLVLVGVMNHGNVQVDVLCSVPCIAPFWQMKPGSKFLGALNAGDQTPGDVSYTSVYSRTDLGVQPQLPGSATSDLAGASNIAVQDLCPVRLVDHAQALYDAAIYAVVIDALIHPGPADPARIDRSVCLQLVTPGLDPLQAVAGDVAWWRDITIRGMEHQIDKEPPSAAWAVP